MIEELGMFIMLLVILGALALCLIVGVASVWAWRQLSAWWIDWRDLKENDRKKELVDLVNQYEARVNKRLDTLERAIYPLGPTKPLDSIPKDVPKAQEREGNA